MDNELKKINGLMKRLIEFNNFTYSGDFSNGERDRMLHYVTKRYSWIIDDLVRARDL